LSGILNKKERLIDFQLTDIGKQKLSDPLMDESIFSFVGISDNMAIYEEGSFTDVPMLEVAPDLGTISSVGADGSIGFHSWNDELLYNCVFSGTTETNSNGFDYYDVDGVSGESISCIDSSFVASSFFRKLSNCSNLLLENNNKSSFNVVTDGNDFSVPLKSSDIYNFSEVVSVSSNLYKEGFSSHPDITSNIRNFKEMSPLGISSGNENSLNYKSKSNNIGIENRESITLDINNAANNSCVCQIYNIFAKSDIDEDEDGIDFSRLSFVRTVKDKYVVGVFFNKKNIASSNKLDEAVMSLVRESYFDVGNSRLDYPNLDNINNDSNLSTIWHGDDVMFMKIFSMDILR
jgi:hypothetical protein